MDSNKKIDLINAYRQLVGLKLKLNKSTSEEIENIVQGEFQKFILSSIETLLNGKKPEETRYSQFSEEDMVILNALISGVKERQKSPNKRTKLANSDMPSYDQPQTSLMGHASNARPIIDQDPDGMKARNAQFEILKHLAKMENEGPDF